MAKGNMTVGSKSSGASDTSKTINHSTAIQWLMMKLLKRKSKKRICREYKRQRKTIAFVKKAIQRNEKNGVEINYKISGEIYSLNNKIKSDKNDIHFYDEAIDAIKKYKAAVEKSNKKSFSKLDFIVDFGNYRGGYKSTLFNA